MGLHSCRLVRVPILSHIYKQKCLNTWALKLNHEVTKEAWFNQVLFYTWVARCVCVHHLPGKVIAPACTLGRRKVVGGTVILWAMIWYKIANHMNITLTYTTYLNMVANQVHPFMQTVFTNGSYSFHQYNMPWHTIKNGLRMVWETMGLMYAFIKLVTVCKFVYRLPPIKFHCNKVLAKLCDTIECHLNRRPVRCI